MTQLFRTVIALLLLVPATSFADVRIHAHSLKNNVELTINQETGKLKKSPTSASSVSSTTNFTIRGGTLYRGGNLFYKEQPFFKATEILTQSCADGVDIVVVRVETLRLGNPLAFIAGHPKQVANIVVAGFRDGRMLWQHNIAKEAYSTKWQASISPPEA